jgi:hypothetical protein
VSEDHGHEDHGHGRLRHLPAGSTPAVFAGCADVAFAPPLHADQLEQAVSRFYAALSVGLVAAGCSLVGHVKGAFALGGHGDLAFHATTLTAEPALTGGFAGMAKDAVLTVNVIVFGVDEQALPDLVVGAWSQASDAETDWRRRGPSEAPRGHEGTGTCS